MEKKRSKQPDVVGWLNSDRKVYTVGKRRLTPAEYFNQGRPFSPRQLDVLDRAGREGFLYDPDALPAEFHLCETVEYLPGQFLRLGVGMWPPVQIGDQAEPAHRWWGNTHNAAIQRAGLPGHYGVWASYCFDHGRPPVTVGLFHQDHFAPPDGRKTLGLMIQEACELHDLWPTILPYASAMVDREKPLFRFDGLILTMNVTADDAERIARSLADRIAEVVPANNHSPRKKRRKPHAPRLWLPPEAGDVPPR